ncbi:MAG TPA: hypothetical protein PLF81_25520 [Candidatus Anammoximicrobium sp.]|nr:hypothetical protein [Candidatus Anammoximicrobium sp.]
MKRLAIVLAVLTAIGCMTGCSGLQASTQMASIIDRNADHATDMISATQPADVAKAGLKSNAEILGSYFDAATVNVFAYWFGGKQIFCTAAYYNMLRKSADASAQYRDNVANGMYSDDTIKILFVEENKWILQVKDAKDGKDVQR